MSTHIAWFAVCIVAALLFGGWARMVDHSDQFERCMKYPVAGEDFCTLVVQGRP